MESNDKKQIAMVTKQALSKAGYLFSPEDDYWQLDKNINIPVGSVCCLLGDLMAENYINTLLYYASNLSASHTKNINERFCICSKRLIHQI